MGRANVYLPDELERRVRAARVPISEVCQRALVAAVEAAESGGRRLDHDVAEQVQRGRAAGEVWAASAAQAELLAMLRDQRFPEMPSGVLPHDLYALTREQSLGWEAGFTAAARNQANSLLAGDRSAGDGSGADGTAGDGSPADGTAGDGGAADGTSGDATAADGPASRRLAEEGRAGEPDSTGAGQVGVEVGATRNVDLTKPSADGDDAPRQEHVTLGDDSGCTVGTTVDEDPVCFDPHSAVRAGKSPLFAILGEPDLRARLTLSVAQDAAARGTAAVLVDLSGELASRAGGLGRKVRVIRTQLAMPPLEDLVKGAVGLGGLWQTLAGLSAGSGIRNLFPPTSDSLIEPGYVTILNLSGDGALATALSAAHGLTALLGPARFPRLVHIDLPAELQVPTVISGRLGRFVRAAREQNAAVGLSAGSAEAVTRLAGSAAPLSTVFAFATSNPVEAERLRDLLGASAPVLLNPPGAPAAGGRDGEAWAVMRDLHGRLGQVRIQGS